jgi:hypothetical protein
MQEPSVNLGICFADTQLFYALSQSDKPLTLTRIGKYDFNFDIVKALQSADRDSISGLLDCVDRLVREFKVTHLKCLFPAKYECWSTLPKSVYDESSERESYLKLLMYGKSRSSLEPFWFDVSNRDYRFLAVRDKDRTVAYKQIGDTSSFSDLCSDFEIGLNWIDKTGRRDTFLLLGCYRDYLVVSSYIMGKLRAATYIRFKYMEDLSYLWLQQSEHLPWLKGVNDCTYFYGEKALEVSEILYNHLDSGSNHIKLDNLSDMYVKATEETYSFNLEEAFPAIILAT